MSHDNQESRLSCHECSLSSFQREIWKQKNVMNTALCRYHLTRDWKQKGQTERIHFCREQNAGTKSQTIYNRDTEHLLSENCPSVIYRHSESHGGFCFIWKRFVSHLLKPKLCLFVLKSMFFWVLHSQEGVSYILHPTSPNVLVLRFNFKINT